MKHLSKYIFGICMIISLLSCRSQKNVAVDTGHAEVIKDDNGQVAILNTEHSFKTMKIKRMSIDLIINGLSDNIRGNMAVSRDSLIVISVIPLLGYEALRIMCTKDSIVVINRADKTYHASSFDYYIKKYNIPAGFNDLQAVLINEAFFYMSGYTERKYEKEIKIDGGRILYIIESLMGTVRLTNQQIIADSAFYKIKDVLIVDYQKDVNLEISYSGFDNYENEYFPSRITIDITDKNNSINLDIEYGQVIFDDLVRVKFEIPENYSRIYM